MSRPRGESLSAESLASTAWTHKCLVLRAPVITPGSNSFTRPLVLRSLETTFAYIGNFHLVWKENPSQMTAEKGAERT